jgi:hypothetical protein
MQDSSSIVGAEKPACLMAPTGQIRVDGHGWFWGQRLATTCISIDNLLFFFISFAQSITKLTYPQGVYEKILAISD